MIHIPVLVEEVIKYLNPKPGDRIIDATFGEGGHSLAILPYILPKGKILGIDWDPEILKEFKQNIMKKNKKIKKHIILKEGNFREIKKIVQKTKFTQVVGIIFDLGISSWHLEKSKRGFSFQKEEFLDMRFSQKDIKKTAFEIINSFSKQELTQIFKEYGEEKRAEKISSAIVKYRKTKSIKSAKELANLIESVQPLKIRKKLHPATLVFQALRIFVNQELINLQEGLKSAFEILQPNGRIIVISFHSLEDRIVKSFFKEKKTKKQAIILTKKPIQPSKKEISKNPRARSAKLRALKKI